MDGFGEPHREAMAFRSRGAAGASFNISSVASNAFWDLHYLHILDDLRGVLVRRKRKRRSIVRLLLRTHGSAT